jgi:3D (Asp-Asp-Asp) domain-containing protein
MSSKLLLRQGGFVHHHYFASKIAVALFLLLSLSGIMVGFAAPPHTLEVVVTAYSSTPAQTDNDPTVTATGQTVRPGILAVSRDLLNTQLPYGTQVRILEIRADEEGCGGYPTSTVFNVQDTMASRIENQVDIWMPSLQEAVAWGSCVATLEVVAYAAIE